MTKNNFSQKTEIRQQMLKKRRGLSADDIAAAENSSILKNSVNILLEIARKNRRKTSKQQSARAFSGADTYQSACTSFGKDHLKAPSAPLTVMSYMSFQNEFPMEKINKQLLDLGIRLVLPLTDNNFVIHPYNVNSLSSLKTSRLGIAEPDPTLCRQVSCEEPDVIFVPGVSFDRSGNRIGFGRGCYDRFLTERKRPLLLAGFAYNFQVVPFALPAEPLDIAMNFIVTETELIRCTNEPCSPSFSDR